MEKSYMQHHLGGLNQQAKCQATTAQEYLEEVDGNSLRVCKSCLLQIDDE
jgi:hypothetical protein